MLFPITALYAGLLFIVALVLGFQVGRMRVSTGVSIHHGDNMELATAIRRHANFTENVPYALVLLAIIEANGAGAGLLHGLGVALLLARIAHPIGLRHDNIRHPLRGIGAFVTIVVMAISAGVALWQVLG